MIETLRCYIRPVTPGDASFILELLTSALWKHFIGDRGISTVAEAKDIIEKTYLPALERPGFGPHVVILKETHTCIGTVGIYQRDNLEQPDLGFAFLPNYLHQGFGYESATAHLAKVHSLLHLPKIYAITNDDNLAAQGLLLKMNFTRTAAYQPLDSEGKADLDAVPMGLYTLNFQEN